LKRFWILDLPKKDCLKSMAVYDVQWRMNMKQIVDRHNETTRKRGAGAAKRSAKRNPKRSETQTVDIEELKKSHAQALAGEGRTIDEILADVQAQANARGRAKSALHKS
jgi:hypothetical protein